MSCFFDTDKNDCRRECCGCILTETLLVRGSMGPAGPTGAQGPAGADFAGQMRERLTNIKFVNEFLCFNFTIVFFHDKMKLGKGLVPERRFVVFQG